MVKMMKSQEIQELVIQYKTSNDSKIRNKLLKIIVSKYEKIILKLYYKTKCDIDDTNEFFAIAHLQLLLAIDRYNPDNGSMFNTYCHYWLMATPRIFWQNKINKTPKQHKHIQYTDELVFTSDEKLIDFEIDLRKILNEDELLCFKSCCNKKLSSDKMVNIVCDKILKYMAN